MNNESTLYSWRAEESVLGFLFNTIIKVEEKRKLLSLLTPDHFSNPFYKFLFDKIAQNVIFDKIVLWDKIKVDAFMHDGMPLTWTVLDDIDEFVTQKDLDSYVEIIIDKYQKRKVHSYAKEMQEAIESGEDQFSVALKAHNILANLSTGKRIKSNQELLDEVLKETKDDTISTGFKHLDHFLGGYTRGMIITIAGDSGHCKTTWALDKIFRMSLMNPNFKIGVFSKEMTAKDLIKKQISYFCKIPINKIFAQDYDREYVRKKMKEVESWWDNRIQIISPDSFSTTSDIAKIQLQHKFDVWVLDFIQLLGHNGKSASSSSEYNIQVSQDMRALQSLALSTESIGIVLSQIKKGVDLRTVKRPTISDIEWSGVIKQLSTYILFTYYPCKYYGNHRISPDKHYILGEKTRFSGGFTYPMKIDPNYGIFREVEDSGERSRLLEEITRLTSSEKQSDGTF